VTPVLIFIAIRSLNNATSSTLIDALGTSKTSSSTIAVATGATVAVVIGISGVNPLAAKPLLSARLNSSTNFIGTAIARASSALNFAKSLGRVNQFASKVAAICAPTPASPLPNAPAHLATNASSSDGALSIVIGTVALAAIALDVDASVFFPTRAPLTSASAPRAISLAPHRSLSESGEREPTLTRLMPPARARAFARLPTASSSSTTHRTDRRPVSLTLARSLAPRARTVSAVDDDVPPPVSRSTERARARVGVGVGPSRCTVHDSPRFESIDRVRPSMSTSIDRSIESIDRIESNRIDRD
jgi:hypothetical protein